MYSDYLTEYTDKLVLETDKGFATYSYHNDTVYLENIYVKPEHRQKHEASALANRIAMIARGKGCTKMVGSVVPSAKNSTISLKVLLGYGMQLTSAGPDIIYFQRTI